MIISQSQLDISNKSYTNKDFADVYMELLSYAEKLSYRFSPISANETDPFIIMLKLAAFVCDKVNYNVDKNILERFMSSCTQETSMRELSSMMGYYMHYYRSAVTDVVFKHNTTETDIIIPKFSTLTNQNDIQFVTLAEATIDAKTKRSTPIPAAQGKLKTLSILGNSLIQLENLDSNNRVYFPEAAVAENGVFITSDIMVDTWDRVENLNEHEYLSPIFYFGYDSMSRLPYMEFPSWISQIIGNGLSIKYLVSNGYDGNIAAGSFKSVSRISKSDELDDAEISVVNTSSTTNGADPESIEQSYAGFKKLVGTLDTLVTCRDYAAKIYELTNVYGNNLVSNVVVSDRRSDLNYSTQLYTLTDFGKTYKSVIAKNADGEYELTPHDICIYPYAPLTSYSLASLKEGKGTGGYNDAYKFLAEESAHSTLQAALEGSKSISHTYKKLQQDDIVAIYIYLKLTAVISTNVKVSAIESAQIINKVNQNLLNKYNSRTISIGYEIPFDELYTTIMESDSRIKSVSLQEPIQTPAVAVLDSNNTTEIFKKDETVATDAARTGRFFNNYQDCFEFIALKNVVSGHIQLFDYDTRFEYKFYDKKNNLYENISHITTEANIELTKDDKKSANVYTYTLADNEAIQIIGPKFNSFITYPYGVLYNLHLNRDANGNYRYIKNGDDYKLDADEYIIFAYADTAGNWTIDEYTGSNNSDDSLVIINPNFNMLTTSERLGDGETPDKKLKKDIVNTQINNLKNAEIIDFYMLSANDEVQCKKPVTDKLDSSKFCYWSMNGSENKIQWPEEPSLNANSLYEYEYILRENEYFYYSDTASTALVEYGSGTKLVLTTKDPISRADWKISAENSIAYEDITEDGIRALVDHFILKPFSKNDSFFLDIYINDIKTLTCGDTLSISYGNINPTDILTEVDGKYIYKIENNDFAPFESYKYTIPVLKPTYALYTGNDLTASNDRPTHVAPEGADANSQYIKIKAITESVNGEAEDSDTDPEDAEGSDVEAVADDAVSETKTKYQITLDNQTTQAVYDVYKGARQGYYITYNSAIYFLYKEGPAISTTVEMTKYPEITYTYDGADIEGDEAAEESSQNILPDRSTLPSKYQWKVRGLLDIDCGPDKPQVLGAKHVITLANESNPQGTKVKVPDEGSYEGSSELRSNIDITINGGSNVYLSYIDPITLDDKHPTFKSAEIDSDTKNSLSKIDDEFYYINLGKYDDSDATVTITAANGNDINFYIPNAAEYTGFMIYVPEDINMDAGDPNHAEISLVPTTKVQLYTLCNIPTTDTAETGNTASSLALHNGVNNIIAIIPQTSTDTAAAVIADSNISHYFNIKIKNTGDSYLKISNIKKIDGLNEKLGLYPDGTFNLNDDLMDFLINLFNSSDYIKRIPDLDKACIFADIENSKLIEVSKAYPLNSAQGFYDPNNVANAWVLPRIDFNASEIKIASNSLK